MSGDRPVLRIGGHRVAGMAARTMTFGPAGAEHGPPAFGVMGRCSACHAIIDSGPHDWLGDAEAAFHRRFAEHVADAHFRPPEGIGFVVLGDDG